MGRTVSEWVKHPRNNPPPEGVVVEVQCSDCLGDWFGKAMRVDYKPGGPKWQKKQKWRWCHPNGERYDEQAVDAWKHLDD